MPGNQHVIRDPKNYIIQINRLYHQKTKAVTAPLIAYLPPVLLGKLQIIERVFIWRQFLSMQFKCTLTVAYLAGKSSASDSLKRRMLQETYYVILKHILR